MTPDELKNRTLEDVARAKERMMREANREVSWINRHPVWAFVLSILAFAAVVILAVKAYA